MYIPATKTLPLPDAPVTILLVSAHRSDRTSLQQILAHSYWRLRVCTNCRDGLTLLRQARMPVVICDAEQGDDWQWLLHEVAAMPAPPRLIVSSRLADERLWAEALNLGGYDVLATPFDPDEVLRACFLAWQNWESALGWNRRRSAAGD
jgi:DNA-binding NtrC family response regulator